MVRPPGEPPARTRTGWPWGPAATGSGPSLQQHNPLVTIDGGVSYAGAPLIDHNGQVLGAHCVLDTSARSFDRIG